MVLTVPQLSDGVVSLRPPAEADVDAIWAACQDPDIARFTSVPSPYDRAHAIGFVTESAGHWREGSAAPFVVLDRGTGELVGSCGLVSVEPERAEIGYWVKQEARGRGIASRAVSLVSGWALGDLGVGRIDLFTHLDNVASQRVAQKAGFRPIGETDAPARCAGRMERVLVFSLAR